MPIEIFVDDNFSGKSSGSIDYNSSFIGDFWNDQISSIKVYSGTWDFFENANFQGRSMRLDPGEYSSFSNDANDTISSFRQVEDNTSQDSSDDDVRKRIFDLTNVERSRANLPPLAFNARLSNAAQKHSRSMAMHDFYDHRNMKERIVAEGYEYARIGENITANDTPEEAMQAWMNSPKHRDNILNPEFQELGVGYFFLADDPGAIDYHHYWTQCFGTPG